MEEDDTIPNSYIPLPETCSETTHKYRWPLAQTREPYVHKEEETSLFGPIKSSLKDPSLRYHRQSTYTDAFGEVKPFHIHGYSLRPCWLDPVGKNGPFYGKSMYEKDYDWPDKSLKMPRIPLVSTISWGILPLLGPNSKDKCDIPKREIMMDEKKLEISDNKKKIVPCTKNKHPCKDFVDLRDIWSGETTYRRAFSNHKECGRTQLSKPPPSELKFSGDIEKCTTAMRDFQYPKNMKHEEDFLKIPVEDKNSEQSRYPFFIF